MKGQDAEGERVLRRGLTVTPNNADLNHALGLALVRRQRLAEALGPLGRAADLDAGNPRNAYVYGVALKDAGRMDAALSVLEKAQKAHTGDRDLLVALATFNQANGARQAAIEWARRLVALDPQDPQAQALLRGIETQGRR
jgi:Flp pilus assembly protein TadD